MGRIGKQHNPFQSAGAFNLATITVGTETSNAVTVTVQLKESIGNNLSQRAALFAYLSTDPEGDNVVASAPTSVAVATAGLAIPLVTGKAWLLTTDATGKVDLTVTLSSGAATYYLILVFPDGTIQASDVLTFAA